LGRRAITDSRKSRPVYLRYRLPSLDESVPAELLAGLTVEPADILRVGSVGFTARLSDAQRLAAERHHLVAGVQDNPDCLAPLQYADQKPDVPDRYVAKVLHGVEPATVIANVDPQTANVQIIGEWVTATLTADQLSALRRSPGVDFVEPSRTAYPA
jgi:hypothetical protein